MLTRKRPQAAFLGFTAVYEMHGGEVEEPAIDRRAVGHHLGGRPHLLQSSAAPPWTGF